MNIGRSDVDKFIQLLDKSLAADRRSRRGRRAPGDPGQSRTFPGAASRLRFASPRVVEANRCLFCFDAPCTAACPTHIDVPRFIKKIATGNLRGSALTILDANILGLSCSRVCPVDVLCEGACVMHRYNKQPIEIGRLQRYAMDAFYATGAQLPPRRATSRSCASPASAAVRRRSPAPPNCAATASRSPSSTTARCPAASTPTASPSTNCAPPTACAKWRWCARMGVEFRQAEVGGAVSLEELEREFDFIFIGVGLGAMERLGIPGEELPGVIDALRFIERYKTLPDFRTGRHRGRDRRRQHRHRCRQRRRAPGRRGRPPLLPPQRKRNAGVLTSSTITPRWKACASTGWRSRSRSSKRTAAPPPSGSCARASASPMPEAAASPSRSRIANSKWPATW